MENLCLGKKASSSSPIMCNNTSCCAVDGKPDTYAQSLFGKHDLTVDLETPQFINRIKYVPYKDRYATEYSFDGSLDNKKWFIIGNVLKPMYPETGIEYMFPQVKTRYLKLRIIKANKVMNPYHNNPKIKYEANATVSLEAYFDKDIKVAGESVLKYYIHKPVKPEHVFEYSRIKKLSARIAYEKDDKLPVDILPAFLGSGLVGVGVDATGGQSLPGIARQNTAFHHKYSKDFSKTGDLYVFHTGMISRHLTSTIKDPYRFVRDMMPMGHLAVKMSVDGKKVINKKVSGWTREMDVKRACLKTGYVARGVKVVFEMFMPFAGQELVYKISFKPVDGKKHVVKFELVNNVVTRDGVKLLDNVVTTKENDTVFYMESITEQGTLEPYKIRHGIRTDVKSKFIADDKKYSVRTTVDLTGSAGKTLMIDMLFSNDAYADKDRINLFEQLVRFSSDERDKMFAGHVADYEKYYSDGAQVSVNNPKEEFLYNTSLYLSRCGFWQSDGLPINFLFFHPFCWCGATFWDTVFLTDGWIHTNNMLFTENVIKFLYKGLNKADGHPYYWQTLYNGDPLFPYETNTGIQVNPSFALAGIKYYETTKNSDMLKQYIYPVCKKVTKFLTEHMFEKDERGKYILKDSFTDITDNKKDCHKNIVFTGLMCIESMAKTVEYAKLMNDNAPLFDKTTDIVNNYMIEEKNGVFLSCRDGSPSVYNPWGLLYPGETMKFIDGKKWADNINSVMGLVEGREQPWTDFSMALSCLRTNELEQQVHRLYYFGLEAVYGLGYFAEWKPPVPVLVGLPPYASAVGDHLGIIAEMLVFGMMDTDTVEILTKAPDKWLAEKIRFKNIVTFNSVKTDCEYDKNKLVCRIVKVSNEISRTYDIVCRIPVNKTGKQISVLVDGNKQEVTADSKSVRFRLELKDNIVKEIIIR
jgi:hypothetical protein